MAAGEELLFFGAVALGFLALISLVIAYVVWANKKSKAIALLEDQRAHARAEERKRKLRMDAEVYRKVGRYEEAARLYEAIGELDRAKECRELGRTTYVISADVKIGKNGVINLVCPRCGAPQPVLSKSGEAKCSYCGNSYVVPKKVLDLI